MDLLIQGSGDVRCIYGEEIGLVALGALSIRRGSHVEPGDRGEWFVDLSPVAGPTLGPFATRSEGISAEIAWLSEHWLEGNSSGLDGVHPESLPCDLLP